MHPLCRLNASASRAVICQKPSADRLDSACHLRPALLATRAPNAPAQAHVSSTSHGIRQHAICDRRCSLLMPSAQAHDGRHLVPSTCLLLSRAPSPLACTMLYGHLSRPRLGLASRVLGGGSPLAAALATAPNARACNSPLAAGHSQFRSSRLNKPHRSLPFGCMKHSSQTAHC